MPVARNVAHYARILMVSKRESWTYSVTVSRVFRAKGGGDGCGDGSNEGCGGGYVVY